MEIHEIKIKELDKIKKKYGLGYSESQEFIDWMKKYYPNYWKNENKRS